MKDPHRNPKLPKWVTSPRFCWSIPKKKIQVPIWSMTSMSWPSENHGKFPKLEVCLLEKLERSQSQPPGFTTIFFKGEMGEIPRDLASNLGMSPSLQNTSSSEFTSTFRERPWGRDKNLGLPEFDPHQYNIYIYMYIYILYIYYIYILYIYIYYIYIILYIYIYIVIV